MTLFHRFQTVPETLLSVTKDAADPTPTAATASLIVWTRPMRPIALTQVEVLKISVFKN